MASSSVRRTLASLGTLLAAIASVRAASAQQLTAEGERQIRAIYADKAAWTPAERKLATSLLYAHRESLGRPMVPGLSALRETADLARVDAKGYAIVDVKGKVTEQLLATIRGNGGFVLSSFPQYDAVRAQVPIRTLAAIAALPEVRFVEPEQGYIVNTGTQTSQGDLAHAAAATRTLYGINGSGVKVGVLSDGVDSLAARQATGDLPPTCGSAPCVTVVPGQAGSGDEGTAMLEIVYDLAPGAQLFYATGASGDANFAANILALRNTYGCDVIIDDITYFNEGAFQDGIIAQAVSTVRASGALYFSSAANSGRLSAGTSGTWEGDFVNSGTVIGAITPFEGGPVPVHSFNGLTGASAATSDALTASSGPISLKWSNPLGGATDDYDLFRLDSTLTAVLGVSNLDQGFTLQPYEIMNGGAAGQRIVAVLFSGVGKALRVDTNRGRLSIATAGATFGHNAGDSTISVAATAVSTAGGGAFTGGAANPIETYSSDGPRRIFFNPNGSEITPGNVLFGTNGGRVLRKPDITAADCVTTTTPGFVPFCGTSAAAPHAGAIAALVKSLPNHPSADLVQAAMQSTALDVNPTGWDKDSGVGIVMADKAATVASLPSLNFYTVGPCRVFDTREVSGPTGGAPLTCGTIADFTVAGTCGVPAAARAVSLNVTVASPSAQGNVRLFAAGAPTPTVSTLNFAAAQTRANNAVAPLSGAGKVSVLCSPSGTSHVILDVNGYFQ